MRIAIAGISHETNTYCGASTPLSAFSIHRGEQMLKAAGTDSDVGGAIDACSAGGYEAVPIFSAGTQPSGTIERDAYDSMKEEILEGLASAGAVDACVLNLHGAGVVDGIDDLEGDLAVAVRELVGDIPIAATFDLHANMTQRMADALDAVFVCRHYPHIDMHIAARDAVNAVAEMARTGRRGRVSVTRLPLLLPTTTTFEGIGQEMYEKLMQRDATAPCINISWCHGFPYTDISHVGSMVVLSRYTDLSDEDEASALAAQAEHAAELWARREEFRPLSLDGDEAVRAAQDAPPGMVVINETSDNCGGGAPGDGTHLLRAMLEAKLGAEACFAFLVDPEVALQAHEAGTGAQIEVSLGGKTDDLHGEPLVLSAYVKALHDGRVVLTHMFRGMPLNLGPMARLVVDDMDIVVASRRSQTFDREPFLAVGIDVERYRYVALKSSNHFRGCFQDLADTIVTADTPGLNTHHIERFPRQATSEALWPIDERAMFAG